MSLRFQLNKQLCLFADYLDIVKTFSFFPYVLERLNPRTLALLAN